MGVCQSAIASPSIVYPRVSSEFVAGYTETVNAASLRNLLELHLMNNHGVSAFNSPFVNSNNVSTIEDCEQLALLLKSRVLAYELALAAGEYCKAVNLIANKYRLPLLISYVQQSKISPQSAWQLAREIWINSTETSNQKHLWQEFFSIDVGCSAHFMSAPDLARLCQLPETIKIFRGYGDPAYSRGISWTMSRVIASSFSGFDERSQILQGYVSRDHVIGYISLRDQFEIVVDHENAVTQQRTVPTIRHAALLKRAKNGSQSTSL